MDVSIPMDLNFYKWRLQEKLPFIPREREIDQLIAGCNSKTSTFLQLLKETGMRCGEAWSLRWVDLDFEQKILTLNNPEKNGKPRQLWISDKLRDMLKQLKTDDSEKLWTGSL